MSRRDHELRWKLTLPRPLPEVFDFFAAAVNLQRITPPELRFRILDPVMDDIHEGTLIDYRLGLFGIPLRWRTVIARWDPPHSFTDIQLRGPYRKWEHTHTFAESEGGTMITDHVLYQLPLFPFGEAAAPLVGLQLRRIFGYRERRLRELLG